MSPITDVDDSAAGPADLSGMVATEQLDARQKHELHPFRVFCERVMDDLEITKSRGAREVCSAVCADVARLSVLEKDEMDAQAEQIAKFVAKDREEQGDRQLWKSTALRIAKHALELRLKGEGYVGDAVVREAAEQAA